MFAETSSKNFSLSQEAPEVTMTLSQKLHSRCLNCPFDDPSSTTVTGLIVFFFKFIHWSPNPLLIRLYLEIGPLNR